MGTYTYEQFRKAAQDSGLLGEFSQADLNLAQRNPDAGMSILKYRQDYHAATTDEAKALAHMGAEQIRSAYGNYTGGQDGSGFYLNDPSPSSFTPGEAPTYQNRYEGLSQNMLSELLNRKDFTYDPETDPLYQNFRKQYTREGQRATADTLGTAAAATGGIPSSYATTAAAQAGNYYAAQLADRVPELQEVAYNQYLNDYNMQLSNLETVQAMEQMEYNKYLNELQQYKENRDFRYGQLLDEINSQTMERQEQRENAIQAAEYGDYSGLEALGIDMSNNPADFERRYTLAVLAAKHGDYSGLEALGIDTSNDPADFERRYTLAMQAAEYGDFSGLEALGIKPNAEALAKFNLMASGLPGGAGSGDAEESADGKMPEKEEKQEETPAAMQSILAQYPSGRVTDEMVWKHLVSTYGEEALRAAGITDGTKYGMEDLDAASVKALGLGDVSYEAIEQLVEDGKVKVQRGPNGLIRVSWNDGYSAKNSNKVGNMTMERF